MQGTRGGVQGMRGDMEVAPGSTYASRAQQALDPPESHPRFQSVCGEGMAQPMGVHELREVRGLPSVPADAMHHACRDRARPEVAGKEPRPRFLLLPRVA